MQGPSKIIQPLSPGLGPLAMRGGPAPLPRGVAGLFFQLFPHPAMRPGFKSLPTAFLPLGLGQVKEHLCRLQRLVCEWGQQQSLPFMGHV